MKKVLPCCLLLLLLLNYAGIAAEEPASGAEPLIGAEPKSAEEVEAPPLTDIAAYAEAEPASGAEPVIGADPKNAEEVKDAPSADTAVAEAGAKPGAKTAAPNKEKFRMKNRMVELSLVNVDAGFSTDFVTLKDLLQETAVINADGIFDGFNLDIGVVSNPFSLLFNWKDKWGFGLAVNIDVTGNVLVSGNALSLKQVNSDTFGMGAAAFVDLSIPVFFHVRDYKIKIKPAAFVPVAYTEPGITYSYKDSSHRDQDGVLREGVKISMDYDMYVYTPVSAQEIVEGKNVDAAAMLKSFDFSSLGYDLGLGVEYPLYDWLDVGVDITNFPIVNARLDYYMRLQGQVAIDTSYLDMEKMVNGEDQDENFSRFPEEFEPVYGKGDKKSIYRPFTMLFYTNYRPIDSSVIQLIPSLGFSINPLYVQRGAVEGGLSVRFDLANIFIATLGINYNNRMWRNSIDFVLFNLRAFEFDIGIASQSQDFAKSWQGGGVSLNMGIKLGW